MDLIFRRANLPDGQTGIDIGIEGDRIVAVEPQLQATAAEEIDAKGRLLSPPFVDPHFHMDATLSLGLPRMNRSGTLLEGIALWGELKPRLTHEAVVACHRFVGRQSSKELRQIGPLHPAIIGFHPIPLR